MTDSSERVVWITGAGSGMGAAVARRAAAAGWRVALSGRRPEALGAVAREIDVQSGTAMTVPLDVTDHEAALAAVEAVRARWGRIDAVVAAAGLNSPRRRWDDQRFAEFDAVVDVNLRGVASVVDAALPELRARRGVVVVVSSYAAWTFNPVAGVAYTASKTALSGLVRTLNAQEAARGVRACHLCPGDVATDFLRMRPVVPDDAARAVMLTPEDIARTVQFVLEAPSHVRYDELVVSPVSQV